MKAGDRVIVRPATRKGSIFVPEPDGKWRMERLPDGFFEATLAARLERGWIVQPDDAFLGTTIAAFAPHVQEGARAAGLKDGECRWFLLALDGDVELPS